MLIWHFNSISSIIIAITYTWIALAHLNSTEKMHRLPWDERFIFFSHPPTARSYFVSFCHIFCFLLINMSRLFCTKQRCRIYSRFPFLTMLLSKNGGDICRRKLNIQVVTRAGADYHRVTSELTNEWAGACQWAGAFNQSLPKTRSINVLNFLIPRSIKPRLKILLHTA